MARHLTVWCNEVGFKDRRVATRCRFDSTSAGACFGRCMISHRIRNLSYVALCSTL